MNTSTHRRTLTFALAGSALLAACGGTSTSSAAPTTTTPAASSPAPGAGGGPGGGFAPGASGSVASISGASMEVQNPRTGQVTVSWKPSTTFTTTVDVTASAVTAGDCVTVTGTASNGTIVARSVSVSRPSGATCTRGAGLGGRRPGAGAFTGSRAGGRSGAFAGTNFSFAAGKVTSVSAGQLMLIGSTTTGRSATAPRPATSSTVKVQTGSSTVYTETRRAAASALAVGDCVTANGATDSTGAVTASVVRITSTGGKACTTGFGGRGGGAFSG